MPQQGICFILPCFLLLPPNYHPGLLSNKVLIKISGMMLESPRYLTMKATIKTAGTQLRIKLGDIITVDRLTAELGSKVIYDNVLLLEDGEQITVGTPVIENATVEAEVLEHFRGKKIRVFKMRRRKKYRRTHGHRSDLSKIRITGINV